jgi:DNA repair photolyase
VPPRIQDHASLPTADDEADGPPPRPDTLVTEQLARSIISRNDSPDIGFEQSINPYAGCEHGCIYCYARHSHAYLGLSPGLEFETRIFAKSNAAELLGKELGRPGYRPAVIALGANTDPYQPAERRLGITRSILQLLKQFNAPVSITTKSALLMRDIDILSAMARRRLVRVNISIATLDPELARKMDPRAPSPKRRLEAIAALAQAGVPVAVFSSPVIPALTERDLEKVLEQAAQAGASHASYVVLRLPLEVRQLFLEWLNEHFPLRARHVMSLVAQMSEGRDYNPQFGKRMRGSGVYAELIAQRFELACARLGLNREPLPLDLSQFAAPGDRREQLPLF